MKDAHTHNAKTIIVFGATSTLAKSTIRSLAARGYNLVLCARDITEAQRVAADAHIRHGAQNNVYAFDAVDEQKIPSLVDSILRDHPYIHGVLVFQGYLNKEDSHTMSVSEINKTIDINFRSIVLQINAVLAKCTAAPGFIGVVTSIAGVRGKKRNLTYNAAKGAMSIYLEGLRQSLRESGTRVIDIRAGFMDTPMTYGMKSPLIVSTDYVGKRIVCAISRKNGTLYVPWFWFFIMCVIKNLPQVIYDRLKL